jgi:hypothetical protein
MINFVSQSFWDCALIKSQSKSYVNSHLERFGLPFFSFAHISDTFPARISHQGGDCQREKIASLI